MAQLSRAALKDLFGVRHHIHQKFDALIDSLWNLIDDGAGGGAAPYLVYTAVLTQSGTNPPVATVLQNTLGEVPTYSYSAMGKYVINTVGNVFTSVKTAIFSQNVYDQPNAGDTPIITPTFVNDPQTISLHVINATTGAYLDDVMIDVTIEIRVYP